MITGFGNNLVVVVLDFFFPLRRHLFLHGGQHKVGGALKDGDLRRRLGDFGQHLDGGGARANDADSFSCHIEALGPARRVEDRSGESIGARERGDNRLRNHTHGADKIFGGMGLSVARDDIPEAGGVIEAGALNFSAQLEHRPERKLVQDKFQIGLRLFPARVSFCPGPLLQDFFRKSEAVIIGFAVCRGAGVAIPGPRSADLVGAIKHFYRISRFAQVVAQRNACEACADGNDIVVCSVGCAHNRFSCLLCPRPGIDTLVWARAGRETPTRSLIWLVWDDNPLAHQIPANDNRPLACNNHNASWASRLNLLVFSKLRWPLSPTT